MSGNRINNLIIAFSHFWLFSVSLAILLRWCILQRRINLVLLFQDSPQSQLASQSYHLPSSVAPRVRNEQIFNVSSFIFVTF